MTYCFNWDFTYVELIASSTKGSKHPESKTSSDHASSLSPGSSDYSHRVTGSCKQSPEGEAIPPERQMALYSVEMALMFSGLWVSEWKQRPNRSELSAERTGWRASKGPGWGEVNPVTEEERACDSSLADLMSSPVSPHQRWHLCLPRQQYLSVCQPRCCLHHPPSCIQCWTTKWLCDNKRDSPTSGEDFCTVAWTLNLAEAEDREWGVTLLSQQLPSTYYVSVLGQSILGIWEWARLSPTL